jgi:hypothetical protein
MGRERRSRASECPSNIHDQQVTPRLRPKIIITIFITKAIALYWDSSAIANIEAASSCLHQPPPPEAARLATIYCWKAQKRESVYKCENMASTAGSATSRAGARTKRETADAASTSATASRRRSIFLRTRKAAGTRLG